MNASGYSISNGELASNYVLASPTANTTAAITVSAPPSPSTPNDPEVSLADAAALGGALSVDSRSDSAVNSAKVGNVIVNLITLPTLGADGAVAVFVPREMETVGVGFRVPLPHELSGLIAATDEVSLVMANGDPLPSGLSYEAANRRLVIAPVPGRTFPMSVILSTDKMQAVIVITERT